MLSIIKLRLMGLKDNLGIMVIMTLMALGFSYISGAANSGDYTPTVIIVDVDSTQYSTMLIDELKSNRAFKYVEASYEDAVAKIESNSVSTAIVIEKGFGEEIQEGKIPTISLMKQRDDRDVFTLESILSSVSNKMIGNIKISQLTANYISPVGTEKNAEIFNKSYNNTVESWKYRRPIEVKKETYNSTNGFDALKHGIIGFTLFFSMYTIVFAIGEILNDKKNNTWGRMMVSPLSRSSILGGNFVMSFIIGVVQVSIIILGGKYIFNLDLGSSMIGIFTILLAFVFAVTALGLLLSGVVKTHSQLAAATPIVLTSTAMLGGCMWPLEIVNSKALLLLANLTPQKWAIEGMSSIAMYGKGFDAVIIPVLVLLTMGLVFFGIGVKLVKFE